MIHCMGNSHAAFFSGHHGMIFFYPEYHEDMLPEFKAYRISNTLAYNLWDHKADDISNICNSIVHKKNDHILLCYGEVDCRWHLGHQAEVQDRPINDLIKECVERYFKIFVRLKSEEFNLIGWGVHPSTTEGPSEDLKNKPIYKDCLYRNSITKEFNRVLKSLCDENDIKFACIFEDLVNEDGLTKMHYFQDYCHLNQFAMHFAKKELKRIGVL